MRDHTPEEILEPARFPLESSIAAVRTDASAPEVSLYGVKHLGAISVLADGKAWPHLPSHEQSRSWRDGYGEAAFAVDVTGDVPETNSRLHLGPASDRIHGFSPE
jgi:hypothetical protein